MKAIYQNRLYVCVADQDGECITLEEMGSDRCINAPLSDPTLIIDPTDDQYFAALEHVEPTAPARETPKPTADTIDFCSEAVPIEWDSIEVRGVQELTDEHGEKHCEALLRGDGETPHFWSVYLHQTGHGVHCVADLPTERLAVDLANLILFSARRLRSTDDTEVRYF